MDILIIVMITNKWTSYMQFLRGLDESVDLSELSREISGLSNHNILGMGEKEKFFSVSKEVAVIMYIV